MKKVIIESPYAGDIKRNVAYARAAMKDCLNRNEAPYASHLLYTQEGVLDDNKPEERQYGIDAGIEWSKVADLIVVYNDFGITPGMQYAIDKHIAEGRQVEYRSLPEWKNNNK